MLFSCFKNKRILITGASSGIGRQIAIDLSNNGANLYILGRNRDKLVETKAMCSSEADVDIICIDLVDKNFHKEFTSRIKCNIDGIVFCAGMVKLKPIAFVSNSDFDDHINVNFRSSVFITQNLLRNKLINAASSIVFISSVSSKKPIIANSLYSASKSAINSFAQSLALETASKKIRVNTILPGYVETDILKRSGSEEEIEKHLLQYPLGRFGEPKDISSLVCFLLSESASWITGAEITIDGGFSLK